MDTKTTDSVCLTKQGYEMKIEQLQTENERLRGVVEWAADKFDELGYDGTVRLLRKVNTPKGGG